MKAWTRERDKKLMDKEDDKPVGERKKDDIKTLN